MEISRSFLDMMASQWGGYICIEISLIRLAPSSRPPFTIQTTILHIVSSDQAKLMKGL